MQKVRPTPDTGSAQILFPIVVGAIFLVMLVAGALLG